MMDTFPHYHQLESADCGPSCLRMIAKYYGRNYSVQYLNDDLPVNHHLQIIYGKRERHRITQ